MIRLLVLHTIVNIAALYILTLEFFEGTFVITGDLYGYLTVAIIFGILNSIVKPVLKVLTLPIMFISAGLFAFVINMGLVWFVAYALNVMQLQGVTVTIEGGMSIYLYIGIVMALSNMVVHWLVKLTKK